MAGINEKEFMDELIFCLRKEDIIKAKALLQFASDSSVRPAIQVRALQELAKSSEKVVFPLLEYLTRIEISDPGVQEGLYDLILDKAYGNTQLVIDYITENEKKARLLFLKAAGDLLLVETADTLKSIITRETDKDILFEAITALGALRLRDALPVFSDMVNQPDMKIKRAAVFAISQVSGNEAVDRLLSFISKNEELNKIVVEALTDIQELYALEKLTSLLRATETIVRDTAIDGLMKLGNKAVPTLTRASRDAGPDYLVHLITTLGYIGDPAALSCIIDIINTQPENANIRQAAYEAIERIPSPKSAICLAQGLQDPVESVRMSAARAIDQNLSKTLVAGLKNIVRTGSAEAQNAVAALIDSESANIFNFLVQEESFMTMAQAHITRKADPVTREKFLKHMNSIGQKDFVNSVNQEIKTHPEKISAAPTETEVKIFVVDDSKMMLKLYQNKLATLGFKASLFQKPEEAIPEIIRQKPDLVITDLNMPNISGLELTREIRRKFVKSSLPILMITTQSDFIEEKDGDILIDDSVLTRSGINKILHKPFTDEIFKETILQFINK